MSNDQIELQKFIRSPSTPERMSGTGSFGQPSSTSFSPNVGDTVVGQMAPLYQTVPDAKVAHARYTGRIPSPSPGLYTTPSESDPPNEYDLINEKQVRGGRTQHVSENVLYGDQATATQFRHAATLEKKDSRFSGSISEPVKEPGTKESACGCTLSTMFFSFFHVVGIVIGLTALVLVILLILGVLRISSPSCDCTSNPQDVQELQELRTMVTALMDSLEALQQNTTASQSSINSTLNQLAQNVEAINSTGIAAQVEHILDTRLSGVGLPESFPANLTAVDTHYNCTTTLEENCNIPISLGSLTGSSPCATEDIPMNREVSVPVLKYAH